MKKMFIYANISLPILAGSLLYYVTSPQVMFVQNIDRLLGVSLHVGTENTFVVNLRSYMPDMLWAYALVFSLMLVTGNKTADVMENVCDSRHVFDNYGSPSGYRMCKGNI